MQDLGISGVSDMCRGQAAGGADLRDWGTGGGCRLLQHRSIRTAELNCGVSYIRDLGAEGCMSESLGIVGVMCVSLAFRKHWGSPNIFEGFEVSENCWIFWGVYEHAWLFGYS